MEREQVRLGLISCAERLHIACGMLCRGAKVPSSAEVPWGEVDELRVEHEGNIDPTTLLGSFVIVREFLDEVADSAFHGCVFHHVPWPETRDCLEAIIGDLRESRPVSNPTLMNWWRIGSKLPIPALAADHGGRAPSLPIPARGRSSEHERRAPVRPPESPDRAGWRSRCGGSERGGLDGQSPLRGREGVPGVTCVR